MVDKDKLLKLLNEALAQEIAGHIRYATHAAVITGPYAESVGARLGELATDELRHADALRERIVALGGKPTMEPAKDGLIAAYTLDEIIDANLKDETRAMDLYRQLLSMVRQEGDILFETLEEVFQEEQRHREQLERLRRH